MKWWGEYLVKRMLGEKIWWMKNCKLNVDKKVCDYFEEK